MIYLDTCVIYRRCQAEPMMLSADDLVGAAKAASKPGKPKAASKSGKKPALAPDDEPVVTVATDRATGNMTTVPKVRPTRGGASGNLQTAK